MPQREATAKHYSTQKSHDTKPVPLILSEARYLRGEKNLQFGPTPKRLPTLRPKNGLRVTA